MIRTLELDLLILGLDAGDLEVVLSWMEELVQRREWAFVGLVLRPAYVIGG